MTDYSIPAQPANIADIFRNMRMTDQYGQAFDPVSLGKGPALVLFGYGGCPMCQKITQSVAVIQEEMEKQGRRVPIVVVSVQPEDDRDNMEYYLSGFYSKGVKQFSNETLPIKDVQQAYHTGKNRPQGERLLHVVCPPTAQDAQNLERAMGLIINQNHPKQHSSFITLFHNGTAVRSYRGLPPHGQESNDAEVMVHAANLAPAVAMDIATLNRPAVAQQPNAVMNGSDNTSTRFWNLGIPALAGLAVAMVSEGLLSIKSILLGLLAVGGASLVTQWVTGSGLFSPRQPSSSPSPIVKAQTISKARGMEPTVLNVNQARAREQADTVNAAGIVPLNGEASLAVLPQPRNSAMLRSGTSNRTF